MKDASTSKKALQSWAVSLLINRGVLAFYVAMMTQWRGFEKAVGTKLTEEFLTGLQKNEIVTDTPAGLNRICLSEIGRINEAPRK